MKLFLTTFLIFYMLGTRANYCAGVRGNGELALSHWSALSRIVENKGMPSSMAGGSSAAVTLFFMDALSRHQNLNEVEQGLLLKTFVPHLLYLFNEDANAPTIMRIISNFSGMGDKGFFGKIKNAFLIAKDAPEFFSMLGEYGPIINPSLAKGLKENFSFYKTQATEGISVFGEFDAKNDQNIFYRRGLVDFKYLGILFGRMADFYAGYGNEKTNLALTTFLKTCADVSKGKTWNEIVTARPSCQKLLNSSFDRYYEYPTKKMEMRVGVKSSVRELRQPRVFPNKMIFEKIGSGLNVFPTTSLIIGSGVERYKNYLKRFESSSGKDNPVFSIDFDSELRYGYWGNEDKLEQIKNNLLELFPNDTKSSKFEALNGGTWFEVLATSPAEPGLSSLLRIPDSSLMSEEAILQKKYFYSFLKIFPTLTAIPWINENHSEQSIIPFREGMFSAGGWSDLHPSLVLRASGCDDIMYVTRQGGESVFGQQIFIRLTGYTDKIRFWKDIRDRNRLGWDDLTIEEKESPWNRLYNLANPESSYNRSIQEADSVYCTDWDRFNVFKGEISPALDDAYHAPLFLKDPNRAREFDFGKESEGKSPDGFPGCLYQF